MSDALLESGTFDHGTHRAQGAVRLVGCEDVRPVIVAAGVDVYAVVVDERREALDHHPVPIGETAETAAHELYVRVCPPHYLGELAGLTYISFGRKSTDLPLPVHLVAQPPVFDVVRLLVAVLAPEVGPVGVARAVAVLDPGLGLVHRACPHVDADVGLGPQQATVLYELVRAEAVGFFGGPREIHLPRTLLARTDPVGPVVSADEVPTGPAQDRYPQVFRCFENVVPVASSVAERRILVEDATVDTATQVLDKAAENLAVQPADPAVEVELDLGHPSLLSRVREGSCTSLQASQHFSTLFSLSAERSWAN